MAEQQQLGRAFIAMEFAFPDERIRREIAGRANWSSLIMAVGTALLGDRELDGAFARGGSLAKYAPWVREIGDSFALKIRQTLGIKPDSDTKLGLQMGVEPLSGNRFRMEVTAAGVEARANQADQPKQLSFLPVPPADAALDMLVLPSSLLYQHTRSAISAGREGLFTTEEGDRWPTHRVALKAFKANMTMQPEPIVGPAANYGELVRDIERHIEKMDDLGADVFDIISAKWIQAGPISPGDMITLSADDFLAMRGLMPNIGGGGRRGGYKETQRQEIAQRVASLDKLWVNVREMVATVREDGRRSRKKVRLQTKAIVVTMQAGEVDAQDGLHPYVWRLRPGDGFAEFLLSDVGRETALMALKALEYNPESQRMEKRLTRYLSVQWRIRRQRTDYLIPYKVGTLLAGINEKPEERRPARQRERLEKALDRLHQDGVVAGWQYEEGCDEEELSGHAWQEKWLSWGVVIEPCERIRAHYAGIGGGDAVAPRAALPPGNSAQTANTVSAEFAQHVRQARVKQGLTQLQLAEQIGVNRSALAQIETGKRKPSAAVEKKLLEWMAGGDEGCGGYGGYAGD